VSGPDAAGAGQYRAPAGLLEKLVAAVRPEFRAGELAFDPRDPVFGGKPCLVPACERPVAGRGLCQGHRQRWTAEGRPDVREFAASTGPRWRRSAPLTCCQAPGCGYGVGHRKGLCSRHAGAWERAGTPSLPDWLGTLAGTEPAQLPEACLIGSCGLWAEPGSDWCRSHTATWRQHGRPSAAEFTARWADDYPGSARERIRLDGLPAQMKLEMQYALQRRRDDREGKAPPYVVMIMIRFLAGSGASSLLELTEQEWRDAFGRKRSNAIALLAWSRRQVADLAEGGGWDAEYPRGAWQMHRLGFEGRIVLDFSRIPQQDLKDLANAGSGGG
jgi:hypothetical protein